MINKQSIIKLYYLVLILALVTKVGATIFSNGLAVHHGKKIAQLQIQKNNLTSQQVKLTSQLSEKTSIASISQTYDLSSYTQISNPVLLTNNTTVASN